MTIEALPWTPDFESYAIHHHIDAATARGDAVQVRWSDGRESLHHALWLRENSPDTQTIHPVSREMLLDPLDIPSDLIPDRVSVLDNGALEIVWSHDGLVSTYHPGWLREHAYFEDDRLPENCTHLCSSVGRIVRLGSNGCAVDQVDFSQSCAVNMPRYGLMSDKGLIRGFVASP